MLSGQKDLLGLTEFLVESSSVALFFSVVIGWRSLSVTGRHAQVHPKD